MSVTFECARCGRAARPDELSVSPDGRLYLSMIFGGGTSAEAQEQWLECPDCSRVGEWVGYLTDPDVIPEPTNESCAATGECSRDHWGLGPPANQSTTRALLSRPPLSNLERSFIEQSVMEGVASKWLLVRSRWAWTGQ